MSALGVRFDLVGDDAMVKGLPWSLRFTRRIKATMAPIDLTGCAARLVITNPLDAAATPLVFSTVSGHIVLGGVAGTVDIDLDETDTTIAATRLNYRLYFTDSLGLEKLLMRGQLALVEED